MSQAEVAEPREGAAHCVQHLRIAVLLPCHNEETAVPGVVRGFNASLPGAEVYVFDNNSTDSTVSLAQSAGAWVRHIPMQGKGNVVRRAFADVDADVYVLADGDGTYDAAAAPALVARLIHDGLDMVVGLRSTTEQAAYRSGHRLGNRLLTRCVSMLFGRSFEDMLSGYRVFSRRYVKSFPAHSTGFEIETELTVHALQLRMPVAEVGTAYRSRPDGSASKLSTFRDGFRILATILGLFQAERPLAFFSLGSAICMVVSLLLAIPLFETYLQTGLVPRFPTAILCAALAVLSSVLLACGLILDTVTRGRIELKRMAYLAIPLIGNPQRGMGNPVAMPTRSHDQMGKTTR